MKTFTVASLFTSAFAAVPAHTAFNKLDFYAGSTTCAEANVQVKATVIDECFVTGASASQKYTLSGTTGLSNVHYGTAMCTGTPTITVAETFDTCVDVTTTTGGANGIKAGEAWVPAATDFVYGFYSDSGCTTRDGLTAAGLFSRAAGVTSGSCVADKPLPTMSTNIVYSSSSVTVDMFEGSTTCDASVTPITLSGVPGTCKEVPATVAAFLPAECTSSSACYIYVFPLGGTGPSSSSAASTSTVAATAVVAAAGAAALLL